jgi:integrase
MRFEDFVVYARDVGRHSPFSLSWYRNAFSNFNAFLMESAHLPPEKFEMCEFALDEWIAWNSRRNVRPISMNSYWRALRAFYLDRERRDKIPSPFTGRKPPSVGEYSPKALSAPECSRILLAAMNYPWSNIFERELALGVLGVMLYAGLRRSEVLRLTMNDVQLDQGTIRVIRGKGRFGGKDRMAYIPPELEVLLRAYLRQRQRRSIVVPEYFASAYTGNPIGEMAIREVCAKVSRAAQIKFSPHILRHSFVTQLLRSGVPLHVARDLAGHSSIETTLGYLRVFDEDRKENIRKIRFR